MYLDYYNSPELQLDVQKTRDKKTGLNLYTLKGKPLEVADDYASYATDAVRIATQNVMHDFWFSRIEMLNPYAEFNDMDVLSRTTKDLKVFNAYVPPPSDDPDLAWMSDAYSPIARNKVISVAAHLTRATVFPEIIALDENDNEDVDTAEVMRDLMEWAAEQSEYVKTFLYAVINALVLPAAIVHHEYAKRYKKSKVIQPDGTWKESVALDEIFSGFKDTLLGTDELFIADNYIDSIQKQPYLIWRKAIEYDVAYSKYHSNEYQDGKIVPNAFDRFVRPGIQLLFDAQTVTFYRQYDENLRGNLVEEVQYWHRNKDLHLTFVNGVLVSDPDQPNERLDKLYPFVKGGYEIFNHRFFYYCSLIKKLGKDEEVLNAIRRMFMDGTFLSIFHPTFVQGDETIDGSVVVPGAVIPLKTTTKVTPFDIGANLPGALNALGELKQSIEESAASGGQNQGTNPKGDNTAQEIATVEDNARVMLGLFAKMISFLVRDWGTLYVGDIIQHLSVGEATEILGGEAKLKFQSFLVKNNKGSKKIVFDNDLGSKTKNMAKDEDGNPLDFGLMAQEGHKIKNGKLQIAKKSIVSVNPEKFRKLKYKIRISPEALTPPSDIVDRALNIEEYDRLIANPAADQEEALNILLRSYPATRDNSQKYVKAEGAGTVMPQQNPGQNPQNPQNAQGVMGNILAMKKRQMNPAMKTL